MLVSVFENIHDTANPKQIAVTKILERFKTEDKNGIADLQNLPKETYKAEKVKLPVVCFGGQFTKRSNKNLNKASGLLTLDFDELDNLEELREQLKKDKRVFAVFKSPSGIGLKALVKIPIVKNDAHYKLYFKYFQGEYPNVDQSGKDIARSCFFCYDENLYLNLKAVPTKEIKYTEKKKTPSAKVDHQKNDYKLLSRCCDLIRNAEEGNKHNTILKAARLAGGFVGAGLMEQEEAERILIQEADAVRDDWKDNIRAVQDGVENGMYEPLAIEELKKELESEEHILKFGKIYFTVADKFEELKELRKNGQQKGYTTGHKKVDDHISVLQGSTTYVYAAPYTGKTQWWFEILMCLSERHGLRHAIFSPETGTASQIFAELVSMKAKADFYKTYKKQMSEEEFQEASVWVDSHFIVIDPLQHIITYDDFFAYVSEVERVYNTKIHTTTIDPFNEFRLDLSKHNGRQDLMLEDLLTSVRQNAKVYNRHNCIITHVTDQKPIQEGKIRYYPQPQFREIAGGQAWSRKGMQMISLWRPKEGLLNEHGEPYLSNETVIEVQKSKPKGVGKVGSFSMCYDLNKHRYTDIDGKFANVKKAKKVETKYSDNHEELPYKGYDKEVGF